MSLSWCADLSVSLLNLVLCGTRGESKAVERLEDALRKQADPGCPMRIKIKLGSAAASA